MAGCPRKRDLLMAAGLWPVPAGMTPKHARKLARAKLGLGPGERADRNRAGFLELLHDYRATGDEAEAERVEAELTAIAFPG